ncbi:FHA domain-containing protein [Iningainema tapete]|uniref:FHA domain-containing protein n=1 Tax=Iningainema tapete BLCC-T55 TaxID=2748662 RepID=A0A8J6XE45_9CYAN|nr:FHA domain-containing protein [Iningainema tapete]MBD2770561.1 FHA domain-containing protein [Iningainema tapete BLCC-T55]
MHNPHELQNTQTSLELFHVQTNTSFELQSNFTIIRLGKPKDQFIPDINVANLPNADFVSRLHAEIYVKLNTYYIVDLSSSNGTYLNNIKLEPRKPYPLQFGDKIDLGHGSKVTFLFIRKEIIVPEFDTQLNHPPTVIQIELVPVKQGPFEYLNKLFRLLSKIWKNIWRSLKKLLRF